MVMRTWRIASAKNLARHIAYQGHVDRVTASEKSISFFELHIIEKKVMILSIIYLKNPEIHGRVAQFPVKVVLVDFWVALFSFVPLFVFSNKYRNVSLSFPFCLLCNQ